MASILSSSNVATFFCFPVTACCSCGFANPNRNSSKEQAQALPHLFTARVSSARTGSTKAFFQSLLQRICISFRTTRQDTRNKMKIPALLLLISASTTTVSAINHEGLLQVAADKDADATSDSAASPGVDSNGAFFDTTFFAPLPEKEAAAEPTDAPKVPEPTDKPVDPPSMAPVPRPVIPPTFAPTPPPQPAPTTPPVPVPGPYTNLPPIPPNPYMVVTKPTYPQPPPPPPPTYQGPPPTYPKVPAPQQPPTYQIGPPPTYPKPPPAPKYPTPPPVKIDTRTSHYIAEWGASKENCEYLSPNVFFNCHDGGVLQVHDTVNAICRKLSDDYVQCRQQEVWFDSFVQFTCSGIKHSHLMVTANVGPSPAWNCAKDGNAVKYLTISRTCYDEYGHETSDRRPDCEVGKPWKQGQTQERTM